MGHRRRVGDQRLDAAEALGEAHHARPGRATRLAAREAADVERDHRAEARRLALLELVARVVRQARGRAPSHLRVVGEEVGDRPAVGLVALHAHAERLDAAQRQERVEGRQDRAHRLLDEGEPLGVLRERRDEDAADRVAVAVQELGRRVHDDVGAELERALESRARGRCCRPPAPRRAGGRSRPRRARSVISIIGLVGVST